jgi:hypothetical protein
MRKTSHCIRSYALKLIRSPLFKLLVLSAVCAVPLYRVLGVKVAAFFSQAHKEHIFEKVFEVHKRNISYLRESHPNMMILFSGTPGMGKTVVAKRLEERFHAVCLSSDDVRQILRKQHYREDLTNKYLEWCIVKLLQTEPNHLFIIDKSIDRTFNTYSKVATDHLCTMFLIQMRVQQATAEKRIRSRGHDVETLLAQLSFAWKHY